MLLALSVNPVPIVTILGYDVGKIVSIHDVPV